MDDRFEAGLLPRHRMPCKAGGSQLLAPQHASSGNQKIKCLMFIMQTLSHSGTDFVLEACLTHCTSKASGALTLCSSQEGRKSLTKMHRIPLFSCRAHGKAICSFCLCDSFLERFNIAASAKHFRTRLHRSFDTACRPTSDLSDVLSCIERIISTRLGHGKPPESCTTFVTKLLSDRIAVCSTECIPAVLQTKQVKAPDTMASIVVP